LIHISSERGSREAPRWKVGRSIAVLSWELIDVAVAARLQLDEDGWPPAPLKRRGIDV
jgi:hypothetical protein